MSLFKYTVLTLSFIFLTHYTVATYILWPTMYREGMPDSQQYKGACDSVTNIYLASVNMAIKIRGKSRLTHV